jgi:flagellar hook-basal body complex protein FliE
LKAFRSFAHAALSLENPYSQLQAGVRRLGRELEKANSFQLMMQGRNKIIEAYKEVSGMAF